MNFRKNWDFDKVNITKNWDFDYVNFVKIVICEFLWEYLKLPDIRIWVFFPVPVMDHRRRNGQGLIKEYRQNHLYKKIIFFTRYAAMHFKCTKNYLAKVHFRCFHSTKTQCQLLCMTHTLGQKPIFYPKIHISKISIFTIFTNFTFVNSHFSQNSHF